MSRRQVERALRRAADRDRKRQPRMKVSGKSVFTIAKTIDTRPKRKS